MGELTDTMQRGCALFNERQLDELMALFDRSCRMVMPGGEALDYDEIRSFYEVALLAFADGQWQIVRAIESGDTVAVEMSFAGTQTGPFYTPAGAVPATGKRLSYRTCEVVTFRNGRIAEWHGYYDMQGIAAQLAG